VCDALARETSTSRPASTRVDGPRVRSEKAIARRVLGFFGTSGPGPGSGDTRETSRRAPRLPAPIGASVSLARAPARRHRPDANPGNGAETRAGTANRIRDGGAFSPDWLDRRGVKCSFQSLFLFRRHKRDVSSLTSLFSRSLVPNFQQDQTTEVARKKKRSVKTNNRSIVGASLEVIQKKRAEKSDVRAAARDAALREIKERQRKAKDAKKGKK
jgi:hypothetical protein